MIILPSDATHNTEEDNSKHVVNRSETMTLRKEDMHRYGHCPAHDDFYLVVCGHCGQVVKPQAFEAHCERWHSPLSKACTRPSASTPQQQPRPRPPVLNQASSRDRQKEGKRQGADSAPSARLPLPQRRPAKAHKVTPSVSSAENLPQDKSPHSSSASHRTVPLRPSGASLSERPSVHKPKTGEVGGFISPLQGMQALSRITKNTDKKECDLNKHLKVRDQERKKLCSRELICNIDSAHQQQKGMEKTKNSDRLPVESSTDLVGQNMEQQSEAFKDKTTTQDSKHNLKNNCHSLRSRNFPKEEGGATVEVKVQSPYPFDLVSSEESEDGEQEPEEDTDLHAASLHPKPLGLCTFGCRTLGCSIFTFDRRWHHLRVALSAMLEQHVDTHLLRKRPKVSSGLVSPHVAPPVLLSPVKSGAASPRPTGSVKSTSVGPPTVKKRQHSGQVAKLSSFSMSAGVSPGKRCNTYGQECGAAAKKAVTSEAFHHEVDEKAVGAIKIQSSSPHRTPRNGGKPAGVQQKAERCKRKTLGQKRKGTGESPLISSSLSKTVKCQRFPSAGSPGTSLGARKLNQNPKERVS